MELADKLKKAREYLGKTQKEMAALTEAGYRSWQGYEQGTSTPGGQVFEALVGLGFNATWFFSDNVPMLLEPQRREAASGMVKNKPATPQVEATKLDHPPSTHVGFDDLGMAEGMGLLAKVYSSGDAVFIRAINANLAAFGEAIDNKATARNTTLLMEEMNKRMVAMEKRLHHLEKENQVMRARMNSGDNEEIAAG